MGKYLQKIEVYVDRNVCNDNMVLCVFTMFEYYLSNRINTNGVKKIIINFSSDHLEITTNEILGIMNVVAPFDRNDFINLEDIIAKRIILLESLEKVIQELFKDYNWNYEEVKPTFDIVRSNISNSEEYWKNPKWNMTKDMYALISININGSINIFLSIFTKNNQLANKILIVTLPLGLGALETCLGKLIWINNTTVRFYKKNESDYWFYNILDQKLCFYFHRAEKGDAHGQYDLGMMYLNGVGVLKDEKQAICWFKKSADQKYARAINQLKKNNM